MKIVVRKKRNKCIVNNIKRNNTLYMIMAGEQVLEEKSRLQDALSTQAVMLDHAQGVLEMYAENRGIEIESESEREGESVRECV